MVIRFFLLIQMIGFTAASLMHFGVIFTGYEHDKARIAESIIAFVLMLGFIFTFVSPAKMRKAAIYVQSFALLGTLVGLFTIIIGVGPQSRIDIIFHITIITLLVIGLVITNKYSYK